MNIINETTYDLVKLKYILFNKFDQRVFYKILKMEKSESCIPEHVTEIGFIYPDATSEKINDFLNENCLNSSTHFKINDNETYRLLFNLKIDEDEIKDHVKIISSMEFKWSVFNANKKVIETTTVSQKDKLLPFDNDKLYFVIIYPNNQIPALVRVYDSDEFDLLNIDDKNAIYNSYLENVNVEKSTETKTVEKIVNNASILKMEEDENVQKYLKILSNESFDPATGVYHNDKLNLTVDENNDLIIDGVNLTKDARDFDFDSLDKRDDLCTKFDYSEQLKEMMSEFLDDNTLSVNEWEEINDTFIFKMYHNKNKKAFAITKSKYAIFFIYPIYFGATDKAVIILADLEDGKELISTSLYPNAMHCAGSIIDLAYRLPPNYDERISKNPICEIDRINKIICAKTDVHKSYYVHALNSCVLVNDKFNKSPITDLLTGEDDEGKYVLVRGVFGNLMKYYYEK